MISASIKMTEDNLYLLGVKILVTGGLSSTTEILALCMEGQKFTKAFSTVVPQFQKGMIDGTSGNLAEDGKCVGLKVPSGLKNPRRDHITFKIKGNMYVAGGIGREGNILAGCEQFTSNKKEWLHCRYALPYTLCRASVVTSADETFAVIAGGTRIRYPSAYREEWYYSNGIIIFTEEGGFQPMAYSRLLREKGCHLPKLYIFK